jgi:hypothetical protein
MGKRKIRIPAKDYQPTRAELEEKVQLNLNGMTFDQAMQRLLRPVEVEEVSAAEHRAERNRRNLR